MKRWTVLLTLTWLATAPTAAQAQTGEPVRAAHEKLEAGALTDDVGVTIQTPASHPVRRYPDSHEFPTGPEMGERLPVFSLPNQEGQLVDFHADRGDSKSIVVFFRSAVW
jgi:hypothetical protein